ncbi:uncharacterized protein [Zea mays]|uniref:Uncharacterized protein n=1 Tax=Zea mays TaxID=4577 RepID=B4FSH6_MAIZE|nr:uncharacterized protein LOC100272664 [Zea mays]XP_035820516.1 uncharacterized protein LOC100272664 isoform X1 [Zea mays]ACF85069.1 unknown [Zea mays]ONM17038.1 hypothetical protein ZEAMMB73_Zm00001d003494 [Zea mays]ONM17046.1 hypothetical protein ZEAMMB73_Zm00001d003494 [Zea mays]|eukprot:XP_008667470.1 uncharacterized protein LOC100272664 isoform X2 [Zea mays]
MAALGPASVTSTGLALHTPAIPHRRRRHGNAVACASSSQHQRSLNGLAMSSSGTNNALPIKGITTTRVPAVGRSVPAANPSPSGGNNLPVPKIPPWVKWVAGAVIFAVPMYRRFRALEDKIEKTAEVAIEVIDKVAEATEKVAGEVADEFPGNESIKEAASRIKKVMHVVEEDADKAEALIEKVDEIKKDVDSIVDPIIGKVAKDKSRRMNQKG